MKIKHILLASLIAGSLVSPFSSMAADGYIEDPVSYEGSAAVFVYEPYNQYVVYTRVGYVTDIVLRPGEEVSKVAAGNTLQWAVEKMKWQGHPTYTSNRSPIRQRMSS